MNETGLLIGQEEIRVCLDKSFSKSSGHAFIFAGPEGIGKHSFALEFAKGILCHTKNETGGCGKCTSCIYMKEMSHPDYREILLAEKDKTIKTENIRKMFCSDIVLLPQISSSKVYFIEGDYLNEQSQNAILKTVEELPEYATVIISASSVHKLIPTLMSRMIPLVFKRNTLDEVKQILMSRGLEENADFYAEMSGGIPGLALDMAENEFLPEAREYLFNMLFNMENIKNHDILTEYYSFFETNREYIDDLFIILISWIRDAVIFTSTEKNSKSFKLINEDKRERFNKIAENKDRKKDSYRKIFTLVSNASRGLKMNAGYETCICNMLVQIRKEIVNA